MLERLRGLRKLPWHERWLLFALLALLPLVSVLLACAGYVRSRRWLEAVSRSHVRRAPSEVELVQAQRVAELAGLAGRWGAVPATCLRQSLLVYALLRRRGFDPLLRIGVRKPGDVVEAHAWVELAGQPLGVGDLGHRAF